MKKKLSVTFTLCLAILIGITSISAYANENDSKSMYTSVESIFSGDTLKMKQTDYSACVNMLIGKDTSDEEIIEMNIKAFLTYAKASVREPELYDCSVMLSNKSKTLDTVQYRVSEYQYQAALNEAMGWDILNDDLQFTDYKIEIDGNKAKATVVESYTYFITDGFDSESFRRRMYTFILENEDNTWVITDVTTDDPWETDDDFQYRAIDVESEIEQLLDENIAVLSDNVAIIDPKLVPAETGAAIDISLTSLSHKPSPPLTYIVNPYQKASASALGATGPAPLPLNSWIYTPSTAVTYAVNHYQDTSNSTFGFTSGNNCQNFASQCVWAGLGGSGSSTTARPAVSTANAGTSAFNVWCRNQSTTYYTDYYLNWAWDNVRSFAKLMIASSLSAEGPYGNAQYTDGVQNSSVGEVLTVDWGSAPAESTLDHAMFVTEVLGTYGSRTTSQVKIAAHTSATNSAYQVLSNYTSQSIGSFGRSYVWRGYYSTTQP